MEGVDQVRQLWKTGNKCLEVLYTRLIFFFECKLEFFHHKNNQKQKEREGRERKEGVALERKASQGKG